MAEAHILEEKAHGHLPSVPENDSPTGPSLRQRSCTVADTNPLSVTQPKDDIVGHGDSVYGEAYLGSAGSLAGGSFNRDFALAKLNQEKTFSIIRTWEENIKARSHNRYNRKIAKIAAWESAKKAAAEAMLKSSEENLEKRRALSMEKMKNDVALIQQKAEEERAFAEACHGEEVLDAEEKAAKHRASGKLPKKFPSCFGS